MKKIILLLCFIVFNLYQTNAQIGIGTTLPNAQLDIRSSNQATPANNDGILIPKVNVFPATNPTVAQQGMLVYLTTPTTFLATSRQPGFYYWNNPTSDWIGLNSVANGDHDWYEVATTLPPNAITDDMFHTGNVGIGTSTIAANTKLEVNSGTTSDAIYGHSNNVGGILGREVNFSFGTPSQSLLGAGVYANNPAAGYTSIFAQSTGSATVAANISYSDVWIGSYNYVQNNTSTSNPPANYNQLNITNSALGGSQIALRGYNSRGTTTGNPGYSIGAQGVADSQNQDAMGVQGLSFSNGAIRIGGYFEGLSYPGVSQAYAYVGGTVNSGVTQRKIIGTGSVSEIIPTENHGRVTLTCPESPEYWYQDYGTVEMINGKATIIVDEILADIIVVDEENPLRVICTPVGMPYFNGITIMSQTKNSVEILELNGGNHSGKLQYQLVAKPKTNFGEGRFPQAPGPGYLKSDKEPMAAKAKNQPTDGRKIFSWPTDHIVYKYNPEDYVSIGDVIPAGPNAGKIKLGDGKYGEGIPAEKPKR
ncbi:hypothetical protein [Flavobacterium koreense]